MDDNTLAHMLTALDRTESVLRLVGPGRHPVELDNALDVARGQLDALRGILAVAAQEAEVKRRTLVMALPVLAISPMALERMAAAHRTDSSLLVAYEEVITKASLSYHSADMAELYRVMAPHLARLVERTRSPMPEADKKRLARITAETAILTGWSALIIGQETWARAHYQVAESAALEAGSGDLHALAVEARANLMSNVFYGRWEPSPRALSALEGAASTLDGSAPPIVRQWVLSRLAHEMALAGDDRFLDVVDEARALDRAPVEEPTGLHVPGGYWASGNRLNDIEAVGLAMTGRADLGEVMMRAEREATPDTLPRRHVGIGTILAHVHASQGEPEEAARVAMDALLIAKDRSSKLDVQRIQGVHRRLAQWDTKAVAELGDALAH